MQQLGSEVEVPAVPAYEQLPLAHPQMIGRLGWTLTTIAGSLRARRLARIANQLEAAGVFHVPETDTQHLQQGAISVLLPADDGQRLQT